MTPTPPSSSDGAPLPPRHRPVLGDLSKDTTEMDLWDFDDDMVLPAAPPPGKSEAGRGAGDIPSPRERKPGRSGENDERASSKPPAPGEERIRMNVNKARQPLNASGSSVGQSKPETDFDDLDHWEDVSVQQEIDELPAAVLPVRPLVQEPEHKLVEPPPEAEAPVAAVSGPPDEKTGDDEFSPVVPTNAQPISLRPHLGLSKIERIGLVMLVLLLVGLAGIVYMFSLNRLPRETDRAQANDFPIRGTLLTVTKAVSYWRAPITDGPDADTFRRGTELLPVLEIDLTGGPAAIRVLFRNEDRTVIGDAVTRAVNSGGSLKISATAGFDDPGMHAAYRTGESKPWTIEVYEAATENATGKDFKKVFEMNISTDLR